MEAKDYLEKHWIKNKIWTHLDWPKHQDRLKTCASYLEGKRFIDIGCGLGHSTNQMKKFHPVGDWSGLEFMQETVSKASKLFPDITFYYSKDFNFLPVCGQFDSVICSEVIEHVEDDQALVNGLIDITKKVLVITTPNRFVDDPGHLRVYTEEMLHDLFKGFNHRIYKKGLFWYGVIKKDE